MKISKNVYFNFSEPKVKSSKLLVLKQFKYSIHCDIKTSSKSSHMSKNQQTFGIFAWWMTEYTRSVLIKTCSITYSMPSGVSFKQHCGMAWDKQKHEINPVWTLCGWGEWVCIQRHRESWRSHAFHAATHGHIYHCAKGQRLMAISHPSLASRAMTLSCWLSLALLTSKLPLRKPSHKVLSAVSLHLHLGSRGLTRRKNAEEI